jgi:hypothetical protein
MQNLKLKRSINSLIISLSSALVLSLATTQSIAIENSSITNAAKNQQSPTEYSTDQVADVRKFTSAELEQMLAPIALYPDALLSHILIAATYPIEVVDAERWLEKNQQLTDQERADSAENQDWDASVKALLPFESILKKLSNDLYWMRNIGDAFLQDQAQVLASVQSLRQQADIAGNLDKMDNVNVVRETKTIIIKPAQSEVIYVPYYDTRVVYGDWRWSGYPPVYWHYPRHYAVHHGPYYWHNPVHLTLGLFFGNVHWNNHHVVVHHHKSRYYKHHSNKRVSTSYQAKKWQHNPHHRKGVAYRTTSVQKKYRSHTPSVQIHKSNTHHQKTMRSEKVHSANKSKHYAKRTSALHKNVSHKLKVNQAVKVNKHSKTRQALTKHEPYKDPKWQRSKAHKATYNRNNIKSHTKVSAHSKVNRVQTQPYTAKQRDVKHYNTAKVQPVGSSYTKHATVKTKSAVNSRNSQKKSYHSSNKRSVTKVARTSQKSNRSRSQHGQQKKRN